MRRFAPFTALLLLAACGTTPTVDTALAHQTPYARVRALVLVGDQPRLDALMKVDGELPGTIAAVASPGVSAFEPLPAGDAQVYALAAGATVAQTTAKTDELGTYTLVATGSGTSTKVVVVAETFAPAPGKARVRFIAGTQATPTTALLGTTALAVTTEKPSDWLDIAPQTAARLEVGDATGPLATFSELVLADGSLTTLALVGHPPEAPLRLLVVHELADGAPDSRVLDADGTVKPRAHVRFLNASEDAGAVAIAGETGPTLVSGLGYKKLSADVELVVDAVLHVTVGADALAPQTLALDPTKTYTLALIGQKTGTLPLKLAVWTDRRDATGTPTARLAVAVQGMPGALSLTRQDGSALLPGTAYGTASDYATVPAGPLDAVARLALGPQARPFAAVRGLSFPPDHALTLLAVGRLGHTAADTTLSVLVVDDHDGLVVTEKIPEALPPAP